MERSFLVHRSSDRARLNDALTVDPRRAVALTIDMQRAYLDPTVGDKTLPQARAAAVVAASVRLLDTCREVGIPVVHAYVARLPVELEARLGASRFASIRRGIGTGGAPERPDRPAGSDQAQLIADIVGPNDIHISSKKTTDCYYGTELAILFESAIRPTTVIVLGINTETCVHATVFGTKVRGYQPVVAADCVGSHRDSETSELALELMARTIAWVMPSDEIIARLTSAQPAATDGPNSADVRASGVDAAEPPNRSR